MGFTCKAKFPSTCTKCFEPIEIGDTIYVMKEAEDGKKGTFHHRCSDQSKKAPAKKTADAEKEELRLQMEKWFLKYTSREQEVETLRARVVELEKSLKNAKYMGT